MSCDTTFEHTLSPLRERRTPTTPPVQLGETEVWVGPDRREGDKYSKRFMLVGPALHDGFYDDYFSFSSPALKHGLFCGAEGGFFVVVGVVDTS